PGAEPVSRCLGSEKRPFGLINRTATEARVRSLQDYPLFRRMVSAWKAEPERWSGIRTRVMMITSHLLYLTELSSLDALRLAEHGQAERTAPAGIPRARTRGRAKGARI